MLACLGAKGSKYIGNRKGIMLYRNQPNVGYQVTIQIEYRIYSVRIQSASENGNGT